MALATKIIKSLKRRAKLKRKKPIRPKGKFKAFGANAFKTYRRRRTDAEVLTYANQCRQERLRNRTRAEIRMAELLDQNGILYEIEKIFLNGDRHICVDFFIPSAMIAIEVDGSAHNTQKSYDAGRDRWLQHQYGVRTLRILNKEILRKPRDALAKIRTALSFS
jgi:hypothetical protein